MASSSSSSVEKTILNSSDDKTFKRTYSHPNYLSQIFDEFELKSFVDELVNDNEPTLFGLLLAADYLGINGLLFLACKFLVDKISRDDPDHIRKLFNIKPQIYPKGRGKDLKRESLGFRLRNRRLKSIDGLFFRKYRINLSCLFDA
ncbi:hypothetical protein M9H77_12235 [Catharanthus roseus]|uniref:Uncharacterized protein n=1 Tax=Catharanthus roseus TaxID=4058 RepID=A0ACC0BGU6_CATRO|nr:hypothetical protein M9H77_12235 [Catharanthus roseus]